MADVVTYEEAIGMLAAMFPARSEPFLASVLEAHGGHMERSVEYIFATEAEPPPEPSAAQAAASLAEDEELARLLQDQMFLEELRQRPEYSELAAQLRSGGAEAAAPAAASFGEMLFGTAPAPAAEAAGAGGLPAPTAAESVATMAEDIKRQLVLLGRQVGASVFGEEAVVPEPAERPGSEREQPDADTTEVVTRSGDGGQAPSRRHQRQPVGDGIPAAAAGSKKDD